MTVLAGAYGGRALSLTEIAESERLPAGYLEQLAIPLRHAGLIDGVRGAHGGYRLSRAPSDVTVGDVVRALDGPVSPVECLSPEYVGGSCEREIGCLSHPVWRKVKAAIDGVLDSLTLADLSELDEQQLTSFVAIQSLESKKVPVSAGKC